MNLRKSNDFPRFGAPTNCLTDPLFWSTGQAAEVRIFDSAGRHLRSMGRSGEGSGEFTNPFILWVGDYRPWRYNIFTAEGEFVRRVSLKPQYLNPSRGGGVLDNGFIVNAKEIWARKRDFSERLSFIVEVHDPNGNLASGPLEMLSSRQGSIRGGPPNFLLRELFGSNPEIDALGSTIALAHGSRPEVQTIGPQTQCEDGYTME